MPLFFLHIRSGDELIQDDEGFDLPLEAARREAIRGARGIMAAELEEGVLRLNQTIEIHDQLGRIVESLPFEEAIEIVLSGQNRKNTADNDRG